MRAWLRGLFRSEANVLNHLRGVGHLICPHCGGELTPFTAKVMNECAAMAERLAKSIRERVAKLQENDEGH
jgi:hypothetical protein